MKRILSLILIPILFLAACKPGQLEKNARDSIAAFKGYLVTAIQHHAGACMASQGKAEYCDQIVRAAYAEGAAVTALETYCQFTPNTYISDPQQVCKPVSSGESALKSALANLNKLSRDIKKAAQ